MKNINLIFFCATILMTTMAHAAFKLKPGLWEVKTTTSVDGKELNASQKMNEAMQNMSPSQRKQMEKMMGQKGMNFGESGVKICHTNETMDNTIVNDPQNNCEIKNRKELADGIKFNIQCKNGSGTAEYHRLSDTSYKGFNEFQTEKGKSRTEFTGMFVSNDCGNVKPIQKVK